MIKKIHSTDRCPYCNHWFGEDENPSRLYSENRAKWLEQSARMLFEASGDDGWMDWIEEGNELSKAKE